MPSARSIPAAFTTPGTMLVRSSSMPKPIKGPGQRTSAHNAGKKKRAPTSSSHRGSRVDPSHIVQQQREAREKKARG
jgi:hypothetical protein